MDRREAMRAKDKARREVETQEFLSNVDVLHNNRDGITMPSMEITKESDTCYITYYVVKYPNCLTYHISMYKKDYPFSLYYSKEFKENTIPKKYAEQFKELEKLFNN